MVLKPGEKVHIMVRRNFEGDLRRHFVGKVLEVSEMLIRTEGYVYVLDTTINKYIRRPEKRIRIISLTDAINIINVLPNNAVLENIIYTQSEEKRLIVTDKETFTLDINEFGVVQ